MFFVHGTSFIVSEESIPINHPLYATLANYAWKLPGSGRLTLLAVVMLLLVTIEMILAHRTRFGHNVYAIGGNPVSAALMGAGAAHDDIDLHALQHVGRIVWHCLFAVYLCGLRTGGQRR